MCQSFQGKLKCKKLEKRRKDKHYHKTNLCTYYTGTNVHTWTLYPSIYIFILCCVLCIPEHNPHICWYAPYPFLIPFSLIYPLQVCIVCIPMYTYSLYFSQVYIREVNGANLVIARHNAFAWAIHSIGFLHPFKISSLLIYPARITCCVMN